MTSEVLFSRRTFAGTRFAERSTVCECRIHGRSNKKNPVSHSSCQPFFKIIITIMVIDECTFLFHYRFYCCYMAEILPTDAVLNTKKSNESIKHLLVCLYLAMTRDDPR